MAVPDSTNSTRLRLDQALVSRGLVPTRSRARDAILRGTVAVGGEVKRQPGTLVDPNAAIDIDDPASGYVARSALKLAAALDAFGFSPSGRIALDLGASTGGFTQILLERGASRVFAVDVGHGQFRSNLAADERVVLLEGTNARALTSTEIPEAPAAITADLSFISLRTALPPSLTLAAQGGWLVALVKPQFEVGRDFIGKGGIVRDPSAGEAAVASLANWLNQQPGWRVVGDLPSPITGGDGNREYLLGAVRD